MKCALCLKTLPQRDNRTRNIKLPYEGLKYGNARVHKDCAGVYKEYTNLCDKQKRDKIEFEQIKARIAKAAGHEMIDVAKEKPVNWNFPKLTPPQNDQTDAITYAIHGHKASMIIADNLECDITYDKEVLNKIWKQMEQINDNQLKGILNGTNAAINSFTNTNSY